MEMNSLGVFYFKTETVEITFVFIMFNKISLILSFIFFFFFGNIFDNIFILFYAVHSKKIAEIIDQFLPNDFVLHFTCRKL